MSRTKNVIKMVFASSINQIVVMISGLILPPMIISNYGSTINGLVNSIKQILNYFQVVSVGMGAAGQVALYEPLSKNDIKKTNQIMSELTLFLNKMGVVFLCLVGSVAFVLPIIRNDGIPRLTIALLVLICGTGSFIEFVLLTKYKILLTADQKQYISSRVNTQGTLINVILSVILIRMHSSIICVQLVATFAYIARICLMIHTINKLYPNLNLKYKIQNKIIKNQTDALLYKLTDTIINYTPMTIIMVICGFQDVSVYTVYNQVFAAIVMMVNIFSSGLSSAFGNQIAEKKYEALQRSYKGYEFVFRLISYWLYITAGVLILPFISVYITNSDGVNYLLPSLGICFTLNGLFRAFRTPAITIIDATGMYKENLKMNYFEAILNIVLSIGLTIRFGSVGVLIGGLISALIRSLFFVYFVDKKIIKQSFVKEIVLLGINFMCGVVLYIAFSGYTVNNFIEWIVFACFVAGINGTVYLVLNLIIDRDGFFEAFKRVKNAVESN